MQLEEKSSCERVQKYLQEQAQKKEFISEFIMLKLFFSLINSLNLWKHEYGLGIQPVGLSGTKCWDKRHTNLVVTWVILNIWMVD